MTTPFELRSHQQWLGFVQPVGLVVSAPAMLAAECQINSNMVPIHRRFMGNLPVDEEGNPIPLIPDFSVFAQNVLGWRASDLIATGTEASQHSGATGLDTECRATEASDIQVVLPAYNETLRPTHVVPEYKPKEGQNPWVMLIQELDPEIDLDEEQAKDSRGWHASPHLKFERLLRETNVPCGLLTNGKQIRLVYAPKGETSGYITFDVNQMVTVAGRPIFAAFHMLLSEERMFSMEPAKRLPAILINSRKYQNTVSTQLAQQVMAALFELLRGFQAADDQRGGELLEQILKNDPQHVYHGLLTVLMRMVFILYAEDRGLISTDPIYTNHYSISGLFDRLRSDAGRYPDTMNQRYGAWAQMLTLFRLIYQGGQHADFKIPSRDGYLFDPNRYPFLEGRFDDNDVNVYSELERQSHVNVPRVSDGVIFNVLQNLLVLKGERLSYRTLDVEQIGSVYEAIMGFELEVAEGRSIAIKPIKKHGAPATINLEALLAAKPADRVKLLKEWSDQKLTGAALKDLKAADSIEGLLTALDKKIAKDVTPNIVPVGAMVFQPSDERRRSGSHYTPRSLTEPIVRTTLEPILMQLTGAHTEKKESHASDPASSDPTVWQPTPADKKRYTKGEIAERIRLSEIRVKHWSAAREIGVPHPSQILDLKICDPAMGSGAFLVEVCRQLGDHLITAWHAHDIVPPNIPADEDEVLYARRLIAQRCLYGVDKNIMAVDLAKLSLWLVTLARDHAFTFLDHSLQYGDSLVGLTREQIIGFHWDRKRFKTLLNEPLQKRLDRATEARAKILNAREDVPYKDQEQRLAVADGQLELIRLLGDACVSCFFAESKKKAREEEAGRVYGLANSYLESHSQPQVDHASRQGLAQAAARLAHDPHPVPAFHWEIEFPEVFSRENGGFDAFVGNPPFAGVTTLARGSHESYTPWLRECWDESGGKCDLVAFFFRRTFGLLRDHGCFGLIATNTVAQGDTRHSGLAQIRKHKGSIYNARKRVQWPGQAAVVVSVIHVTKGDYDGVVRKDNRKVRFLTSFLFDSGGDNMPARLSPPFGGVTKGVIPYGVGFVVDDDTDGCITNAEVDTVLKHEPKSKPLVTPYIGGEDFNSSPTLSPKKRIVNFGEMSKDQAESHPLLFNLIRDKVKPGRDALTNQSGAANLKKRWWRYQYSAKDFFEAADGLERVLAVARVTRHVAFAFLPNTVTFNEKLVLFPATGFEVFAVLQSRLHDQWCWFFSSTMKDDLNYSPTDCFYTFPFPEDYENKELVAVSEEYYAVRATEMKEASLGLTKTYNRFHSPDERDEGILELRRLHGLMDGAVLRAYGWDDLAQSARCEFLLDYEEEEDDDESRTTLRVVTPSGSPHTRRGASSNRRRKKKPWRYRWPDEFRDEVLARLLELNEQRHQEELLAGPTPNPKKKPTKKKNKPKKKDNDSKKLF